VANPAVKELRKEVMNMKTYTESEWKEAKKKLDARWNRFLARKKFFCLHVLAEYDGKHPICKLEGNVQFEHGNIKREYLPNGYCYDLSICVKCGRIALRYHNMDGDW
jgi:hypothetical protein